MKDSVFYLQMIYRCYGVTFSVHPKGTTRCSLQKMFMIICIPLLYNQSYALTDVGVVHFFTVGYGIRKCNQLIFLRQISSP